MASRNAGVTLTSDDVNYLVYRYMQESGEPAYVAAHQGDAVALATSLSAVRMPGMPSRVCTLLGCMSQVLGHTSLTVTTFTSTHTTSAAYAAHGGPTCLPAGFHHASFVFANESQVHRADIDPNLVPAGALVAFLQKGMQYMEMEANIEVWGCQGVHKGHEQHPW